MSNNIWVFIYFFHIYGKKKKRMSALFAVQKCDTCGPMPVDQCCIAFFFSFGEMVNEIEHLLFKEERSCLVPVKENALAFCI